MHAHFVCILSWHASPHTQTHTHTLSHSPPPPPLPPSAAEWFIHLPLFNVLLGFPIQFVGLVVTPYLALRYYVDKEGDLMDDAEELVAKVTKKLPGL